MIALGCVVYFLLSALWVLFFALCLWFTWNTVICEMWFYAPHLGFYHAILISALLSLLGSMLKTEKS